jgi:hypothetical protein
MANIVVNTQSAAYQNRHQQFKDIVVFWRPLILAWIKSPEEVRDAWRENDPFLNDLLRFVEAVAERRVDEV